MSQVGAPTVTDILPWTSIAATTISERGRFLSDLRKLFSSFWRLRCFYTARVMTGRRRSASPSTFSLHCALVVAIRGPIMRWLYLAVICVFAAAVIIFAAQNLETGRHALPRFQRHPISTHQAVGGLLPASLRAPNRPPLGLSCHSIFSQGEPQLRGDATKPNAGCLSDLMVSRSDVATPERCRGEL